MLCSCWRWEKFRTFRLAAEQHRTDLPSCLSENFNSQMNGKWKLEINLSALLVQNETFLYPQGIFRCQYRICQSINS